MSCWVRSQPPEGVPQHRWAQTEADLKAASAAAAAAAAAAAVSVSLSGDDGSGEHALGQNGARLGGKRGFDWTANEMQRVDDSSMGDSNNGQCGNVQGGGGGNGDFKGECSAHQPNENWGPQLAEHGAAASMPFQPWKKIRSSGDAQEQGASPFPSASSGMQQHQQQRHGGPTRFSGKRSVFEMRGEGADGHSGLVFEQAASAAAAAASAAAGSAAGEGSREDERGYGIYQRPARRMRMYTAGEEEEEEEAQDAGFHNNAAAQQVSMDNNMDEHDDEQRPQHQQQPRVSPVQANSGMRTHSQFHDAYNDYLLVGAMGHEINVNQLREGRSSGGEEWHSSWWKGSSSASGGDAMAYGE